MFVNLIILMHSSSNIKISNHNSKLKISQPTSVIQIESHNNLLNINSIVEYLVINGHNSTIIGNANGQVKIMKINGHNNHVKSLKIQKLKVNGHNNKIVNLGSQCDLEINGINNKVNSESEVFQNNFSTGNEQSGTSINLGENISININSDNLNNVFGIFDNINQITNAFANINIDNSPGSQSSDEEDRSRENSSQEEEDQREEGDEEAEEITIEELLERYPPSKFKVKGKSDVICSICLDKVKNGDYIRTLKCMHSYHKNCFDNFLISAHDPRCPICREPLI